MENLDEQVKDPNQLDMFAGILFTPEQEQKIADFIKHREDIAKVNESMNKQNEQLLISNGFIKDIHFVNTFKIETVTNEVTLGYTYNKTDFKAEVTYKAIEGGIGLKGKRFYNNEIINTTFSVDFNKDKVQSSTIQDQYRFIKPKTLFEKLKQYSEDAEYRFEEYKKKNNLKQNIIEKYIKLYPNATITVKDDWTKYSGSFQIIEVKFESGSFIQFKLDTYKGVEFLYKKYDAEFEKMNSEELLERFSKQAKKEALN